jgi:hypothetical protein
MLVGAQSSIAAFARAATAAPTPAAPLPAPDAAPPPSAETFIQKGRELLDEFWDDIVIKRPHWVNGIVSQYVPVELRRLEPERTDKWMRTLNAWFWRDRNPKTGLIPYSRPPQATFSGKPAVGMQPVWLLTQAMQFLNWFPDDEDLLAKCRDLGEATIRHFDYADEKGKPGGLWIYVDAATATKKDGLYAIQAYGNIGKSMMELWRKTSEKKFHNWAAQKLEFAWKSSLNPDLPLVATTMTPSGINPKDRKAADTDSLYLIRWLYEIYQVTQEARYRDWALTTTDLWYRSAWMPEVKQFARKLKLDGTPATTQIYGDAKYNFLHILYEAYRVTRNEKYIKRFSTAWQTFLAQDESGLVPSLMDGGKMEKARGLDPFQTMFLQILLTTYEVTQDKKWLLEAQRFGGVVMRAGRKYWRMQDCQAGAVFLRVGLALQGAGMSDADK